MKKNLINPAKYSFSLLALGLGLYISADIVTGHLRGSKHENLLELQTPASIQNTVRPEKVSVDHYRLIWEKNAFIKPGREAAEAPPDSTENLTFASLDLLLLGTVVSENAPSIAIIADASDSSQNIYVEGSEVQGARIVKILKDGVVVSVDGKNQLLAFGVREGDRAPSPQQVASARGPSAGDAVPQVSRTSNLGRLISQVRMTPHVRDGKAQGFKVNRVKENITFKDIGLKSGDIITAIDGRELGSGENVSNFFRTLADGSRHTLTVLRDGERKEVSSQVR